MLKLSKKNLDLQLEIKKMRNLLLTKNIDLSAILPNGNSLTNIQYNVPSTGEPFYKALQLVNNSENDE